MKKTILALTVTTLFSGAALATPDYVEIDRGVYDDYISDVLKENGVEVHEHNENLIIDSKTGQTVATIERDANGNERVTIYKPDANPTDGKMREIDSVIDLNYKAKADGRQKVVISGEDSSNWKPNNNVMEDSEHFVDPVDPERRKSQIEKIAKDNGATINGKDVTFTKGDLKGHHLDISNGVVRDSKGRKAGSIDSEGNVFDAQGKKVAKIHSNGNVDMEENKNNGNNGNDVRPSDDKSGNPWDYNNDVMEAETTIEEAEAYANNWAAQAETQFKQEVARLDAKIDSVEGRVSNGAAMAGAMTQMQFGRDGFGVGAGVANFNGSNAIAVGVGYAFGSEKQWMAKGSFGYAKSNKGNKSSDTMAAAGLTYSFK